MLCKFCLDVCVNYHSITLSTAVEKEISHYTDLADWLSSASDGCELCSVFIEGVPYDQRTRTTSCPVALWCDRDGKSKSLCVLELRCREGMGWKVRGHFCTKPDNLAALEEGCVVRQVVEEDPASENSLMLIQEWIAQCSQSDRIWHHRYCRQIDDPQLPTRVLDLGGNEELELRLFVTEGTRGRYATFSHRWGGEIPRRTMLSCFESYCTSISLHALPQSFQDAARIVKLLGIRYLWIDALCIIQDSTADWERECEKMSSIFSHSCITIAAPEAPNSEAGFLQRRAPPEIKPIRLPYFNLEKVNSGSIWFQVQQEEAGLHHHSLLIKRGWILQEQLLSQRTVYFGTRQSYFECPSLSYLEVTGLYDYWSPFEGNSPSTILLPTVQAASVTNNPHIQWTKIIQAYSPRSLTYPADKFPALSGIAQRFAQNTGCGYLAGHWRENMVPTLAWYIPQPVSPSTTYRAPTWSWASIDGQLDFIRFVWVKSWDAELISDSMILSGSDPFGQVSVGSSITVRARVKIAEIRYVDGSEASTWSLFEKGSKNRLGSCYLDRESEGESGESLYCMQIATFRYCFGHDPWIASTILLLRGFERGNEMVYRRVGYAEVSRKEFQGINFADGEDWFGKGAFRELCIV